MVPAIVPVCSCVRVERLQGVAPASSSPSTVWTACLPATGSIVRLCRPAVLLPCWALGAEPEDLLATSQLCIARSDCQIDCFGWY